MGQCDRVWQRLASVLLLAIPFLWTGAAAANSNTPLDQLVSEAAQYEARGEWREAIRRYEEALRQQPDSELVRQKLWECRVHYDIARRIHDRSYREELLGLTRTKQLALLGEVLTVIQDNYYRPPDLAALQAAGFRSLLVAFDDPLFRAAHLSHLSDSDLRGLQQLTLDYLKRRPANPVRVTDVVYTALQYVQQAQQQFSVAEGPLLVQLTFGLVASLDNYTACLTPQRLKDVYAVIDGEFVGIGVELRHNEHRELEIVDVLPNSPALRAGLLARDIILAIDGVPVAGESLDESADRLQGPLGSMVTLLIRRRGHQEPLHFRLRRDHVEVPSVEEAVTLSPAEGIGYVRLTSFQRTTYRELTDAIAKLRAEGMRALILDLRDNPGGLLTAAVDVADLFLAEGVIVSTSGRANGQSWTYWARPAGTLTLPVVVLVNHESASASEIVAGALKAHHRALIVGERTFGKGTVQSILPLKTADAGIRLTTAEFLSPTGQAYAGVGVEPDVAVLKTRPSRPATDGSRPGELRAALRLTEDVQLHVALRKARELVARRPPAAVGMQ